jgi:hypothetical protein
MDVNKDIQRKIDKFLDKYDFEGMLLEKRHKELLKVQDELLSIMKEPQVQIEYKELDVSGIESAVKAIQTATSELQNSMDAAVNAMANRISEEMSKNTHQPVRNWEFKLERLNGDPEGPIQGGTITAVD